MIFLISVASRRLGVHPNTLRIWERQGVLLPARQCDRRRYAPEDLERARLVHHLLAERGLNLAGVRLLFEIAARLGLDPAELVGADIPSAPTTDEVRP